MATPKKHSGIPHAKAVKKHLKNGDVDQANDSFAKFLASLGSDGAPDDEDLADIARDA